MARINKFIYTHTSNRNSGALGTKSSYLMGKKIPNLED
jgi:hypothetical protein